jgi:DNA repair photolyase
LRAELSSASWKPHLLAISGVTDAYQPIERKLGLTRRCLEVLAEFRNPVAVITKNHLVTRDLDLLGELAKVKASAVMVSVTTLEPDLTAILEPRTSRPAHRLDAIRCLSEAGVPVGVNVAPIIPGLTDHEVPAILEAAYQAGARSAGYTILRLPYAVAPLFQEWLEQHFPDRKDKVLGRLRSMRGGKLNLSEFGKRMSGEGVFAEQISTLFRVSKRRLGYPEHLPGLSTEHFIRPAQPGEQLDLF